MYCAKCDHLLTSTNDNLIVNNEGYEWSYDVQLCKKCRPTDKIGGEDLRKLLNISKENWETDAMLDRINLEEMKKSLKEKGYYQVKNFLTKEEMELIKQEIPLNNAANYNEETLKTNAVYPSMKSDSRESHAHMYIEEGQENVLPHVTVKGTAVRDMMRFHDDALSELLGYQIPRENRKMVNWQMYSQEFIGQSKFLRRHRDGNYCSYELTSDKAFRVKEGLYNQYIFGFNVENENKGDIQGTSFYDTLTDTEIHPTHEKGSLVIFDNIRLEHFVEPLSQPRIFVGIRSFDVDPYHFVAENHYKNKLISLDSPGYAQKITTEEAAARLLNFYKNEWPGEYAKITQEGAVF